MRFKIRVPQFLTSLLVVGLAGWASAQDQPYKNQTSAPAKSTATTQKIPPPLATLSHYTGNSGSAGSTGARTYAPGYTRAAGAPSPKYQWKKNIVTTIFWVGEKPSGNNPTPNHKSAWDTAWEKNFGGYDTPDKSKRTYDFCPKGFTPKQNPFYCALPYNDVASWNRTKPEASQVIPWFKTYFKRHGKSVIKGRWIAIHHKGKTCFAQWEDVGPFRTDDWAYVFGQSRPTNTHNNGAGLDVSPAVRDFLGIRSGDKCHWRFVELHEVLPGPWKKYGLNNHFVVEQEREREIQAAEYERLQRMRDEYLRNRR